MVSPVYSVWCDGQDGCCPMWAVQEPTPKEARRAAKCMGWARRRRDGQLLDLCPTCAVLDGKEDSA